MDFSKIMNFVFTVLERNNQSVLDGDIKHLNWEEKFCLGQK